MGDGVRLTINGSGDAAGIPVHGCPCTLCRQARAVRHIRRRPTSLVLQDNGDMLVIQAPTADTTRHDWDAPPTAVLLCDWTPPSWAGLIGLDLGAGPALPVLGPAAHEGEPWLTQSPGRAQARAELTDGQEVALGRFRVHPFTLDDTATTLALGVISGEQRLLYLPHTTHLPVATLERLRAWQPQVVVANCPGTGRADARLRQAVDWHERLAQPSLILTGIDHRLDQWLQNQTTSLPTGIRIGHDDERLDLAYLNEYRRLGEAAG